MQASVTAANFENLVKQRELLSSAQKRGVGKLICPNPSGCQPNRFKSCRLVVICRAILLGHNINL